MENVNKCHRVQLKHRLKHLMHFLPFNLQKIRIPLMLQSSYLFKHLISVLSVLESSQLISYIHYS